MNITRLNQTRLTISCLCFVFQINHVFDHLEVTRHHTGPVLFIEEDHYLVEDFIYVLNRMFKYAQE